MSKLELPSHLTEFAVERAVSRRGITGRPRRPNLQEIDQALWAAYRKYDRSAVMETLLRRFLGKSRARQACRP
jgi:hypothetical protein